MAPRPAQLDVVVGKAAGMSILVEDELLIGRHSEGAGRLADDDEISRAHARVTTDRSGLCAIEDLGSTNGTFVNGLRIVTPTTLGAGDTIELGATTLVVRDVPSAAAPKAAPPPPDPPAPPDVPAPLDLHVHVDFVARAVELRLDSVSDPVRFVLDAGTWRSVNDTTAEKGGPR
jgi:hypothetical protein